MMRTCSRCGESKPLDAYHKHSRAPDGRRSICKTCMAMPEQRARHAANERQRRNSRTPEQRESSRRRARTFQREWYATLPPDRLEYERARKRYANLPAERRNRHREKSLEYKRMKAQDTEYRERERLRPYGISPEQYAEMAEAQHYLCAICGRKRKLCVDHCHESGFVRGLLCIRCNVALGTFGDKPAGLRRALRYLLDAQKRQQQPLFDE